MQGQSLQGYAVGGVALAHVKDMYKDAGEWVVMRDGADRTGFMLGAGARTVILGPLSVRTEVVLTQKGFRDPHSELRATYLEIPLLLQLALPWKWNQSLMASVGVAPGREVACYAESELPTPAAEPSPVPRREENCRVFRTERSDFALAFGAGYGPFAVAGLRLTPEVRVVSGQMNLAAEYTPCCWLRNRSVVLFLTAERGR